MKIVSRSALNLLAALILLSDSPVVAQSHTDGTPVGAPGETRLTSTAREAVVASLARHLRSDYVFPDVGNTVAEALTAKLANGGYDSMSSAAAFAEALTQDLREIGKDAHFGVRFAPDQNDNKPEDAAQERRTVARQGFGISAVQRLPGNIGYLDVRGFAPTPLVADAYASAMLLLSGTDALIVDLRRNGGGEPQSVTELASYLFAANDVRHLNDLYSRADDRTVEYRTNPKVSVHYMGPVHVLTSRFTFSGGEEFAYDIQTQKRGTLVGEVTGGGANPGDFVPLANGFVAFIPNGRAINPVTKTNWEHVGVRPDVAISASDALKVAYIASLKLLIAKSSDPKQRDTLSHLIASAENGSVPLPGYAPPTR